MCSAPIDTFSEESENTRGCSKEGQRIDPWARQSKTKQILQMRLTEFAQLTDKVEGCHDDYLGPHFKLTDKVRADIRNFSLHFPTKFSSNISK